MGSSEPEDENYGGHYNLAKEEDGEPVSSELEGYYKRTVAMKKKADR
jgi:hypothetical protein